MQTRFYLLLTSILFSNILLGQTTKRILFLGNSYTYVNDLPATLNALANANGDMVLYDGNLIGGYTLNQHSTNATSLAKIRQGNWDFVVLQEQSQMPSFPPSQVATDVYPYAAQLNDSIELYNPCGETVFYMTWGRQNGDASNCAGYPPLCTYGGMQQRLRESYLEMTVNNNAICSPVGAAWRLVRDSFPTINLYNPDESHPSLEGTYLAACVFYATTFRKMPVGIPYYSTINQTDAQHLQEAAAKVVLDSLSNWSIDAYDVHAGFGFTLNNDTLSVIHLSANTETLFWDFGDGNTASNNGAVTHIYGVNDTFVVTLIVSDSCGHSDTTQQTVVSQVVNTPIQYIETKPLRIFPNPAQIGQTIQIQYSEPITRLKLLDAQGKTIEQKNIYPAQTQCQWTVPNIPQGIYWLEIQTVNSNKIVEELIIH